MERDIDDLFAAASRQRAVPSDALTGRILADAAALQSRPRPMQGTAARRPGFLATMSYWLGGAVPLAGVSAAAATGLFLGLMQPTPVQAFTALMAGGAIDSLDLLPAGDNLLAEE